MRIFNYIRRFNYEKLKETFKKRGFEYRLVERSDKVAIYGLYANPYNKPLELYGYEVTEIIISPITERKIGNDVLIYPEQERICCNSEFSDKGWSYQHLDDAKARFNQINK